MKAAIFDFDGTLADTLPIVFRSFQEVFRRFDDKELTEEEIRDMLGPAEVDILTEHLAYRPVDEAMEYFYEVYERDHDSLVTQRSDLQQVLEEIKKQLPLAVVTGKSSRGLAISLKKLGMEQLFDVVISGDDVHEPKPDPEGVKAAASRIGIRPEEAFFAGDSDVDILAGSSAGAVTIGAQWLEHLQQQQFEKEPDYTFADPAVFHEFIKSELKQG
ncbi:HAD family hydrolase [Alkalicoccus chagannorensis]|uniref:HAD family hydrolase n=1 Tax=Alkalicoccus chagannorensis TaxID=427072 RepID=UPI00047AFA50|nr:HAD family hydrolase [Alkalicoccus chagannorensis]